MPHTWGPLTPAGLAATAQPEPPAAAGQPDQAAAAAAEAPKPAVAPSRKRKSRWGDDGDRGGSAAGKEIVLFPEKVVLSNGMQVRAAAGPGSERDELPLAPWALPARPGACRVDGVQ